MGRGNVRTRFTIVASLAALGAVLLIGGNAAVGGGDDSSWIAKAARGQVERSSLTVRLKNGTTAQRPLPFVSNATLLAASGALCELNGVPNCDERNEAADARSGDPSVDT